MSSYMAMPRYGHMEHVFHIFSHLIMYHNTEIVFDPSELVSDLTMFQRRDWSPSEFGHLEGKEDLFPDIPQPRGLGFCHGCKGQC